MTRNPAHRRLPAFFCLALPFLACSHGRPKSDAGQTAPNIEWEQGAGRSFTPREAAVTEDELLKNPGDERLRARLLGYYGERKSQNPADHEAGQRHALWAIEHQPESYLAGAASRFLSTDHPVSQGYANGKDLWMRHTREHPENAAVFANASDLFLFRERSLAEQLLKQAQSLEPQNPRWAAMLGDLYGLEFQVLKSSGDVAKSYASKAARQYERALENEHAPFGAQQILADLAFMAFAAGEFENAKASAERLLQMQPSLPALESGEAAFYGHTLLGRLALREGNLPEARRRLLESGKTVGSPSLKSFGPNMSLAKELLERGEKDPVLLYFKRCREFWIFDKGKLDEWSSAVRDGKMPDFGTNLFFH